jgi:hypothetical protein
MSQITAEVAIQSTARLLCEAGWYVYCTRSMKVLYIVYNADC